MKLIKLSLAAAVATGAFCGANAIALEDAITNIETTGMVRYRYDTDRMSIDNNYDKEYGGVGEGKTNVSGYNSSMDQRHRYKAYFNFKAALSDNFKVYVQFEYHSNDAGFHQSAGPFGTAGYSQILANGHGAGDLNIKQVYFEYVNSDWATKVLAGKQQLGTIWTDDLVGSGIKILNNSIENITLAAYAFDDYDYHDMKFIPTGNDIMGNPLPDTALVKGNIYGAALLANYEPFSLQLWGAYNNDLATLYAVDADAHTSFFNGDLNLGVHAQYLGNSVQTWMKEKANAKNGNFFAGKFYGDFMGADFAAGYYQYGKEDSFTVTTVEDVGQVIYAGQSLIYSHGSGLTGDTGKNQYFFVSAGYTFDNIYAGVDYIHGKTKIQEANEYGLGTYINDIKKNEVVPTIVYTYSPKLKFKAFWSWYREKGNIPDKADATILHDQQATGNFVRFETKYTW